MTSEDIIRKNITRQEVAITYYYCDFSDPKSLEARGVLGTLLRQLLNEIMISEDLKKQLDQFYRPDIRIASTDELVAILFAVIEQFSKVYIFIDGLDECGKEDRNTISSTVKQLAGSDSSIVKIVVTSQETAEISKFLGGFPYIQISEENNSSDIVSFIEETVTAHMRSGVLAVNDFSLKTDIMSALIDGAQGM